MSEEMMLRYCAPTLAGLKTGSLLTCPYGSTQEMLGNLRAWNRRLGKKGLRVIPLRVRENRALVYVYRPERLKKDLQNGEASRVLLREGYQPGEARCVERLMRRLREEKDFPHEIGLFIGYPPADVQGFMQHGGRGCKCVGCWKVYGDESAARRQFARFEKCTAVYLRKYADGRSVEQLTVAG